VTRTPSRPGSGRTATAARTMSWCSPLGRDIDTVLRQLEELAPLLLAG
jgi:hypothetical protein